MKKRGNLVIILSIIIFFVIITLGAIFTFILLGNNDSEINTNSNKECIEDWQCYEWGDCISDKQTRRCMDVSNCRADYIEINQSQRCDKIDEQKIAVILVGYLNKPFTFPFVGFRDPEVTESDFESELSKVRDFFKETSYGKIDIIFNIYGPYTLPRNAEGNCPEFTSIEVSKVLEEVVKNYNRIMYIYPGCGSSGTIGKYDNISSAWVSQQSFIFDRISHELGHNLGAVHSSFIYCGKESIKDISECNVFSHGDMYDVMGSGSMHFNSVHKEKFGWFKQNNIKEIKSSGDYMIAPYEISTNSIQVLKIPILNKDEKVIEWYYLEYRTLKGFDNNERLGENKGPLLHLKRRDLNEEEIYLIDASPTIPDSVYNSAISVGEKYSDLFRKITIENLKADEEGVLVNIKFN